MPSSQPGHKSRSFCKHVLQVDTAQPRRKMVAYLHCHWKCGCCATIALTPLLVVLQSFDLQRVLEGEKALRSEATRQLKEVEKKLVSLRSPAVALSSPMPAPPGSERALEADKAMLQDQIRAHSAQVCKNGNWVFCGSCWMHDATQCIRLANAAAPQAFQCVAGQ